MSKRIITIFFFSMMICQACRSFRSSTPLIRLVSAGDIEAVQNLLDRGEANVNAYDKNGDTALIIATKNGHTSIVRALLAEGVEMNSTDRAGRTALMYAAMLGYNPIVESFIHSGAELNIRNARGESALNLAIKNGRTYIVRLLKQAGAM